jgi:hypothetical protein
MASYDARLQKLEQQVTESLVRFVWMNPGETPREAAARYVEQHKLGVHPDVFLAVAKAEHAGKIRFIGWKRPEREEIRLRPGAVFDPGHFSRRELGLLEDIANKFRNVMSDEAVDVTHAENGAWARVWNDGEGRSRIIPYEFALSNDDPNRDAVLEAAGRYRSTRTKPARA